MLLSQQNIVGPTLQNIDPDLDDSCERLTNMSISHQNCAEKDRSLEKHSSLAKESSLEKDNSLTPGSPESDRRLAAKEMLMLSRGPLRRSCASLNSGSHLISSVGLSSCGWRAASFLGSNTLLRDSSFSSPCEQSFHPKDERADFFSSLKKDNYFAAGAVNSVWSRKPYTPSSQNTKNGGLTLKTGVGHTRILTEPASIQHKSNSTDVRPTKRVLQHEKDDIVQASEPLPKRRNLTATQRHICQWSKEEDRKLEEGVKLYGLPNWSLVAKHVKTRNNKMCAQRWRHCLRPEIKVVKKGKWSKEEDERLCQIVSKYDRKTERTWDLASEAMGFTRNSIQCRERWTNYVDPSLRLGPWTAEEDALLLRLHGEFGNAWKKFTSILTGRSSLHIKRRYTKLIRETEY